MSIYVQCRTSFKNRRLVIVTGLTVALLLITVLERHSSSRGTIRVTHVDDHSDFQSVTNVMTSASTISDKTARGHVTDMRAGHNLNVAGHTFNNATFNCTGSYPVSINCTEGSTHVNGSNCTSVQFEPFSYVLPYAKSVDYPPAGEECKKRLPCALVIGVQKCGTSALLFFLSQHPGISAVLEPTEVNYFSHNFNSKTLDWYRDTMNCSYSSQISMEKSPSYFYCGSCPARVKQMDPDMKIILTVKDPIVRALSLHAMTTSAFPTRPKHFEDIVIDHQTGAINTRNTFLQFSMYPYYLRNWLKKFNLSQIHFVDGHNLETNPAAELNLVERFLDVGNYFTCDMFVYNTTKGKYCVKTNTGMGCLHEGKGRQHENVSESNMGKLQNFFRPLNEKFFAMANRRFDWGY